ncbi:AI-2E family transporter [Gillisia sp. M10.2A]|uniref:AI-2E family transporter n=1 Tax=Gillisia lutea TaxID=2909668 RepID=A0ABS9EHG1_9FLAO|nr:AI-2E family transporter [Gillisia lutea]MCF4102308.1 AI-2E family transporter [Gillisia lutea]
MKKLSPALVRQLFVLMLIIFLGILIFKEIVPYLSGVLGAITLYVILRKWMTRLVEKGWRKSLAAGFLMLVSFVGILIPVTLIIIMLSSKIGKAVTNSEKVLSAIQEQANILEEHIGYSVSRSIDSESVTNWISTNLQSLAGGTFNAFIAIGIMYFMLYYMLIEKEKMKELLSSYIPLNEENIKLIGEESTTSVTSNALGIPLVALIQGIIALIGYLIFGVPEPFFWFVITVIGSMIPFIGTTLGIVPVTLLLLSQGNTFQAFAILIYGLTIVGASDNLVRLYILERLSSVHPLITLFGVVVGVPLFGFIGLIFGPLLISLFLLILKIYKKEYGNENDNL